MEVEIEYEIRNFCFCVSLPGGFPNQEWFTVGRHEAQSFCFLVLLHSISEIGRGPLLLVKHKKFSAQG
jgi:hypothetical protein